MGTNFTIKNPGLPPVRHKPGTLGQDAAKRGSKPGPSGSGASTPSRGGGTSPSRLTARGSGAHPAPPPQEEPPDYRHAILAAQYQNMRGLGRDIPFGASLIRNGHYRDMMPEGQRVFDLFQDT